MILLLTTRLTRPDRAIKPVALFALLALLVLTACTDAARLPGAPVISTIHPANASARIFFSAPAQAGASAIATYVATCTRDNEARSARGEGSPIEVGGLRNGVAYACTVRASNTAGMGRGAAPVTVTPHADPARSLAFAYQRAAWARGMVVTFPSPCTMTVWPNPRPSHAVDAEYLLPADASGGDQRATAAAVPPVSGTALTVSAWDHPASHAPMQFNVCPSKAPAPTAVNAGAIGVMISGAVLFGPTEAKGGRAAAPRDTVVRTWTDRTGVQRLVRSTDLCKGHPTSGPGGKVYHYHGHSDCVTNLVDHAGGPSHLIGVALDGFPIYGDKDMQGHTIAAQRLDVCNGINSPTPEFPQGVYHYVLPTGDTQHKAAMRCYSGAVALETLAAENSSAACYTASPATAAQPTPTMKMHTNTPP